MRRAALALAIASSGALHLAAQQPDVAARLNGRVPAEVVPAVAGVAASAASRGLPVEPLIQKAIEGGAKGRPAQQVIAAVRALADQLGAASAPPQTTQGRTRSRSSASRGSTNRRHARRTGERARRRTSAITRASSCSGSNTGVRSTAPSRRSASAPSARSSGGRSESDSSPSNSRFTN